MNTPIKKSKKEIILFLLFMILAAITSIHNFLVFLNYGVALKYEFEDRHLISLNDILLEKSFIESSKFWVQVQIEVIIINLIFNVFIILISVILINQYRQSTKKIDGIISNYNSSGESI